MYGGKRKKKKQKRKQAQTPIEKTTYKCEDEIPESMRQQEMKDPNNPDYLMFHLKRLAAPGAKIILSNSTGNNVIDADTLKIRDKPTSSVRDATKEVVPNVTNENILMPPLKPIAVPIAGKPKNEPINVPNSNSEPKNNTDSPSGEPNPVTNLNIKSSNNEPKNQTASMEGNVACEKIEDMLGKKTVSVEGKPTYDQLEEMLKRERSVSFMYVMECEKLKRKMNEYTPSLLKQQLDSERQHSGELQRTIYKLKHLINNQRGLIKYAKFKFPDTKTDKDGDTKDVCRRCGTWCSGRYNGVAGEWLLTPEEEPPYPSSEDDYPVQVAICDNCFEDENPDCLDTITILERQFIVDHINRVNA